MTNRVLIGKKGNIHPGYVYGAYIPVDNSILLNTKFPTRMINSSKYQVVRTMEQMMRDYQISKRREKIQKIQDRLNGF